MQHVNGTEEKRCKTREVTRELWESPEYRATQLSQGMFQNASERATQLWQQPEYVQAQMQARGVKQNKLEKKFEELTGWQFVGDGQLIVGGKCPDFWDGETGLVELYGNYWHRDQDPQDRIDHFAQYGYTCLVIWESELKEVLR